MPCLREGFTLTATACEATQQQQQQEALQTLTFTRKVAPRPSRPSKAGWAGVDCCSDPPISSRKSRTRVPRRVGATLPPGWVDGFRSSFFMMSWLLPHTKPKGAAASPSRAVLYRTAGPGAGGGRPGADGRGGGPGTGPIRRRSRGHRPRPPVWPVVGAVPRRSPGGRFLPRQKVPQALSRPSSGRTGRGRVDAGRL